jgi:hypothetical protein
MLNLIILIYLVLHSPAIIMVIIGFVKRRTKPLVARKLFILAAIYFLIGFGICTMLMT